MKTALYTPEARDDVDRAYSEYERRLIGLGDRFLKAVKQRISIIEDAPGLYGEIIPGVRAAPLRKFPFVVYYREEPSQVVIFAIRPGREDPHVWRRRA